jgi:hypothetical protein
VEKNKLMNQIKSIISNTLIEKRKNRLIEVYSELEDIRDGNYLIERYVTITNQLINEEGYDLDEIEIPDSVKKMIPDVSTDIKTALSDTLMISAKEYIFRFIASKIFGAGPSTATIVAQLFADWNPLDLLKIFKNESECIQKFPALSDRLITMVVRNVVGGELGANSNDYKLGLGQVTGVLTGNLFGEVIKETNVSEILADKFCKAIH